MRAILSHFFLILINYPVVAEATPCNPQVVRAIEDVLFLKSDFKVRSRIDTGASQNSLHAEELQIIEENGVTYADFFTVDDVGQRYKMKEQVLRTVNITNTSGVTEKRYVIETQIKVRGMDMSTEVNLKDRTNMNFKFLVGRNLIKRHGFVVDLNAEDCTVESQN